MKKINFISNSKKIKLEITIQNQIIWKDLNNIYCIMGLDLLSKIIEDKNKFVAYLRIAEGCNYNCAFCIIP